MSSWVSHLPAEIAYAEVIGHGMNAEELAANPRLSRRFVQNLNRDPILPLANDSVDAAMICVSIQYLQRPVEVLREVARVLRPGARSSSAFRTAAFGPRRWRSGGRSTMPATRELVEHYLRHAGFAGIETHRLAEWIEDVSDPMIAVVGRAPAGVGSRSRVQIEEFGERGDGTRDIAAVKAISAASRR